MLFLCKINEIFNTYRYVGYYLLLLNLLHNTLKKPNVAYLPPRIYYFNLLKEEFKKKFTSYKLTKKSKELMNRIQSSFYADEPTNIETLYKNRKKLFKKYMQQERKEEKQNDNE